MACLGLSSSDISFDPSPKKFPSLLSCWVAPRFDMVAGVQGRRWRMRSLEPCFGSRDFLDDSDAVEWERRFHARRMETRAGCGWRVVLWFGCLLLRQHLDATDVAALFTWICALRKPRFTGRCGFLRRVSKSRRKKSRPGDGSKRRRDGRGAGCMRSLSSGNIFRRDKGRLTSPPTASPGSQPSNHLATATKPAMLPT